MAKILITGAGGVSADAMQKHLNPNPNNELYFTGLKQENKKNYYGANLSEPDAVCKLLTEIQPHQIYHFAGTYTNSLEQDIQANVFTTHHLLENMRVLGLECRILLIGSAAEYGLVAENENPVVENQALRPISMYGLSKVFQTYLMEFYHRVHRLDVVMARTFNLLDSALSSKLLIGKIYEQIKLFKENRIEKIVLGSLDSERDYIRTQEAVEWYAKIMENGASGEIYNIGAGKGMVVEDIVIQILQEHGLNLNHVEIRPFSDPNKLNVKKIYANISKAQNNL